MEGIVRATQQAGGTEDCLRVELAAVDTYDMVLEHVRHAGAQILLQAVRDSHARRAGVLAERLYSEGGTLTATDDVWDAIAKLVHSGCDLLGEWTVGLALEEGEDRSMKAYARWLEHADADARAFIRTALIPEQQDAYRICRGFTRFMSSPHDAPGPGRTTLRRRSR